MNSEFETAVPAGLIACRLSGVQRHISAISESSLCLRVDSDEKAEGPLEVCFRAPKGTWNRVLIHTYQTGPAHRDSRGGLIRFSFSNGDYIRLFRESMSFFAAYIRAFSEDDVQSMSDYPSRLDENFGMDFDFSQLNIPGEKEICVSLHDPELYALYLKHSADDFRAAYSAEKRVPELKNLHRLYIGNGFCRQLFPDDAALRKLILKAESEGLSVTLVTSPDPRIPDEILANYSGEMLVSDWGLLRRLQCYSQIHPILGTLLNKRRKDPRMHYKPDLNSNLLRQSSVNSPEYLSFLKSLGVSRIEFERCGYDYDLPEIRCSLHLPFYQTNTSVYCPTRALCAHNDRGNQGDDGGCPRYCLRSGLLYPSHLRMLSRWNSLFAADERPLDDLSGFDRVVLNL